MTFFVVDVENAMDGFFNNLLVGRLTAHLQ